jgi:hypothetical protein
MRQISFTSLEKESLHLARNRINNAEDKIDIDNYFSRTATDFLAKVFEEKPVIKAEDIIFTPDRKPYYSVSKRLKESETFKEIWNSSDLPKCIGKMADSFYHRYKHLCKHPEKTDKKIRN